MSKHKQNLSILYRHVNDDLALKMSYYKIILFFSDAGKVKTQDIEDLREGSEVEDPLIFETKNELLDFAHNALNKFKMRSLYLLSNTDYNIGIDSTQDSSGLKEIFKRFGAEIKLSEDEVGGKRFLGKFF